MNIACTDPHHSCYHYNKDYPLLEMYSSLKGETYEYDPVDHVIMFVLKGKIRVTLGLYDVCIVEAGNFMFHPGNNKSIMESLEDYTVLIMRFHINMAFCSHFPLEALCEKPEMDAQHEIEILPLNDILESYVYNVNLMFEKGSFCSYYHDLKLKELLYILRTCFSEQQLVRFFYSILNNDLEFAGKIYKNLNKIRTVKELVDLFNYSYSGFEKRFKKIFGVSAYKWLQAERAKMIYHEINCSTKTILMIGYEFGFNSPSHFNDYCKRMFKQTPGQLRKSNHIKALV